MGGSRKQEVSLRSEQLLQVRLRARVSGHKVSSSGERANLNRVQDHFLSSSHPIPLLKSLRPQG